MTEYPQWLVDRVAKGIYESPSTLEPECEPNPWPPEHPDDAQHILDYAVGALDALKYRTLEPGGNYWFGPWQRDEGEITP